MLKNNFKKPPASKQTASQKQSNFSFGTAMFAMKDMQDMYSEFNQPAQRGEDLDEEGQYQDPPVVPPASKNKNVNKVPTQQPPQVKIISKVPFSSNSVKQSKNRPQETLPRNLPSKNGSRNLPSNQRNAANKTNPSGNARDKSSKMQEQQAKDTPLTKGLLKEQQEGPIVTDLQHLIPIEVRQRTMELTTEGEPTPWEYHMFPFEADEKTAGQLTQAPHISFGINSRAIKQGQLGNCYFITSLASFLDQETNAKTIRTAIPNFSQYDLKSQTKPIKVKIFQSGKLVTVDVENSFKNKYSKTVDGNILTLIFEKAYAQLYGNYDVINLGHSIDAMRDLTGSIAEYIDLKDQKKLQTELKHAFEQCHPMVIASKNQPKNKSVTAKHSFNILNYRCYKNAMYLQLRDPRGWTKTDFQSVPDNVKENQEKDNGEFFVGLKELKDSFEVISVSRRIDNSFYNYKTFRAADLAQSGGIGSISFTLKEDSEVGLSIHQKHKKFFGNEYQYRVICLMLCQIDQKGRLLKCLRTNFNSTQVCSLRESLSAGRYVLTGQMYPFQKQKRKPGDEVFTLSINSSSSIGNPELLKFPCSLRHVEPVLIQYIRSNKGEFQSLITKQNLHRFHGSLFGNMCIYYENRSGKTVREELNFNSENIKIVTNKVLLEKGQKKLILNPIGPSSNCSHKCTFKSRTFYQ